MKVLKALASTLLALLLFICLSVMGVAVTINATALNSGFVTSQINKLDVVALFNEEALPRLQNEDDLAAHPEVISGIQNAVEQNTPALKSAVNKAVADIYAYLLHGGTLDLRQTLRTSVFDPPLTISILNSLDLSSYIHDLLLKDLPLSSAYIAGINVDLTPYADSMVAVIQPWFKEQAALLVPGLYDYVLGLSPTLDLNIPVTPVLGDIGAALKAAFMASPPPALAALPQAQLSVAFDAAWAQTLTQMPATLSLSSSEVGFQPPAQIGQALDNARNGLSQARQGVVYYQEAFWGLVGLIIFLMLLVVPVNRNVKAICRVLGGVLATYGIIEAAGVLISRGLIHSQLASFSNAPQALQSWLVGFIDSLMNPLLIFAVSCAVVGVALFVVSFLYRSQKQETPATF
jgi:hypothetical protein